MQLLEKLDMLKEIRKCSLFMAGGGGGRGGREFFFNTLFLRFFFYKSYRYIVHIITVVGAQQKHKGMFLTHKGGEGGVAKFFL